MFEINPSVFIFGFTQFRFLAHFEIILWKTWTLSVSLRYSFSICNALAVGTVVKHEMPNKSEKHISFKSNAAAAAAAVMPAAYKTFSEHLL